MGHFGAIMGNYKFTHAINNQSLTPKLLPQIAKYYFSGNGAFKRIIPPPNGVINLSKPPQ